MSVRWIYDCMEDDNCKCPRHTIDRLTAELAEARKQQTETNADWIDNQFKLEDMAIERDRYREALERITNQSDESPVRNNHIMWSIAKEALNEK